VDEKIKSQGKKLGFSNVLTSGNLKICEGGTEDKNRNYVNNKQNDVLMNPELKSLGDKVHYRVSGLNQVFAKLALKNDVAIGFGFSFVLNASGVERARILGRMKQNVRICSKVGTKMIVCSYANNLKEMRGAKDLLAFARVIGMSGDEAKKALNWKPDEKKVRTL
jgi:ribonuclease P/MRP protein subunit RPP1